MSAPKTNSALILVDFQQGFNTNQDTAEAVENLKKYSRDSFSCIIATKFINQPGSQFVKQLGYDKMMETDKEGRVLSCVRDMYTACIPRSTYNAAEYVLPILKNQTPPIDTVYIAGFDTDGCVLATALGFFDAGMEVFIIEKLCSSSGGDDMHQAAMVVLERCLGRDHVI